MGHFNEQKKTVAALLCSLFNEPSKICRICCWSISNAAGPKTARECVSRILAIYCDFDRTIKSPNELRAKTCCVISREPEHLLLIEVRGTGKPIGDFTVDEKLLQVDGANRRSRMPNPSSSATLSRRASEGAAAKLLPVLRVRKGSARSGSRKPVSCEPNHTVKTQLEIPTTETFHEMFFTSRPKFVATAYSILRNIEDAEDAVQNAYISGYLHLRNFEGRSALKTWFTRVVLNAALMIRRKRKPVHQYASETEWTSGEGGQWMDAIPSPEPDPETSCAKAEALGLIEELTAELRPTLRQAFSMYYRNDMTVREARDVLRVSTSTLKARLFRARRQVMRGAKRALVLRPQKRMSDGFSLSAVS